MGRMSKSTLSRIFIKYVLVMLGALSAWIVAMCVIFSLMINTGFVYPANYAERRIDEAYEALQDADEITEDMIPPLCKYAFFSMDGKLIDGNIPQKSVQTAWQAVNHKNTSGNYFYKVVSRSDGYLVLQYSLTPKYSSTALNDRFIGPQNMMIVVTIIGIILIILVSSVRFGRKIRAKMTPLLNSIDKIKNQDLEYEVSYSGVKEIDDCISSIDDMKTALKASLEKQWKLEQDKNRQMSALAHDIKTPLTIVRGNAELLSETNPTEEQSKNIAYITNSAVQIQDYVQKLIDVTKSTDSLPARFEEVETQALLDDIRRRACGLAEVYHVRINWQEEYSSRKISVIYDQVMRAVMNVVQNAMEHTEAEKAINISIREEKQTLTICVEDFGKGFSEEALKHGTEQFFMDDSSRGSDSHYGIGLFFARTVAERHGGWVRLANSDVTGGARVEIALTV